MVQYVPEDSFSDRPAGMRILVEMVGGPRDGLVTDVPVIGGRMPHSVSLPTDGGEFATYERSECGGYYAYRRD